MEPIKVLLADDHALFRGGLASLLQGHEDFEVVAEARNGTEAVSKAGELMPDVVLMDVNMPEMDGLEATRRLKEALPYLKVVMLTASEEEQTLFDAIQCGAHGYLLKQIEPEELFEMIKGVLRGEAPISRATATKILGELVRKSQGSPKDSGGEGKLSPRELEVLETVAKGATNKEIASSLAISENTVKNHLKNILEKLHLKNRVEAAAYAFRKGMVKD